MSSLTSGINNAATSLQHFMRLNQSIAIGSERLSSGLRINRGYDDPSGLSISKGMDARISSGYRAAENIQDAINLIQTADSSIDHIMQLKIRNKEILVRGLNSATLTREDMENLSREYLANSEEIYHTAVNTKLNDRNLLNGDLDASANLTAQVGPDPNDTILMDIPNLRSYGIQPPSPLSNLFSVWTQSTFSMFFSAALQQTDVEIDQLAGIRSDIGALQNRLQKALDDLNKHQINLSDASSRIENADMAVEIAELTRNQIMSQSNISVLNHVHDELKLKSAAVQALVDPNRDLESGRVAAA